MKIINFFRENNTTSIRSYDLFLHGIKILNICDGITAETKMHVVKYLIERDKEERRK